MIDHLDLKDKRKVLLEHGMKILHRKTVFLLHLSTSAISIEAIDLFNQ